jgi:hypothetical protein
MSRSSLRNISLCVTLVLLALGVTRASLNRFREKRRAIISEAAEERNRLGIKDPEVLYAKGPTPEIGLVSRACLTPGNTGELVVKGKFVPGTRFLIQSDQIEVIKESVTNTEYRATLKAAAGMGPEEAAVEAFSPISAAYARSNKAVVVTGKYDWDLKTDNGWRITAKFLADNRCTARDAGGEMKYAVEFFRGTETTAFEKRDAILFFSPYETTQYRFTVNEEVLEGNPQDAMKQLFEKMNDPNLSADERDRLMKKMQSMSEKLQAEMRKMADPNHLKQVEAKRAEFGCESLILELNGAQVKGHVACGQKVGRRAVTGTLKAVP